MVREMTVTLDTGVYHCCSYPYPAALAHHRMHKRELRVLHGQYNIENRMLYCRS
jgi:hypothetical protein